MRPNLFECPECKGDMILVWYTEKEIKTENGITVDTGRVRRNVSHIKCRECSYSEPIHNENFATSWRIPKAPKATAGQSGRIQSSLPYTSARGHRGKIYFYIIDKLHDRNGKPCDLIRAQEEPEDGPPYQIPLYDFLGYYNPRKNLYTLYPKNRINVSSIDFPFAKQVISQMLVYDVRNIRDWLPLEDRLRAPSFAPDSIDLIETDETDLDKIF